MIRSNVNIPIREELFEQWELQERTEIARQKRELSKGQRKLSLEWEKLENEKQALLRKQELKEKKLEQERRLFEMKWKILERELRIMADEKRQFEQQKRYYYQDLKEMEKYPPEKTLAHKGVFFKGVGNELALKKRYKDLIKIFHPDNLNGDTYTIQEINREYDRLRKAFQR